MSHVPQIHSEVADLGAALGKAYIHWYDKRQQGLIEDAYLKARNDMERWAADYRRNNKAGNALMHKLHTSAIEYYHWQLK